MKNNNRELQEIRISKMHIDLRLFLLLLLIQNCFNYIVFHLINMNIIIGIKL